MTRKRDRYAGLAAAKKGGDDWLRLTPAQWQAYFDNASPKTLRKTYGQLCRRSGPEWNRIKQMFVQALLKKQTDSLGPRQASSMSPLHVSGSLTSIGLSAT